MHVSLFLIENTVTTRSVLSRPTDNHLMQSSFFSGLGYISDRAFIYIYICVIYVEPLGKFVCRDTALLSSGDESGDKNVCLRHCVCEPTVS